MKHLPWILALSLTLQLGIHNGYLALFKSSEQTPFQVLPYRAELYPKIDQDALNRRICIRSQEELQRLLEDFLS